MYLNCKEYRKSMQLLSLKKRYEKEELTPEKKEEIKKQIIDLEKELEID